MRILAMPSGLRHPWSGHFLACQRFLQPSSPNAWLHSEVKDTQFTAGNLATAAECLAKRARRNCSFWMSAGKSKTHFIRTSQPSRTSATRASPLIAIGDRNDIGFYRELKNSGISDYFIFPIQRDLLAAACKCDSVSPEGFTREIAAPESLFMCLAFGEASAQPPFATTLAWSLAEKQTPPYRSCRSWASNRRRRAATRRRTEPGFARCPWPSGACGQASSRTRSEAHHRPSQLFASLEPLDSEAIISEESFLWLLSKLLPSYRLTIVEAPASVAMKMIWALKNSEHLPPDKQSQSRWRKGLGAMERDDRSGHTRTA